MLTKPLRVLSDGRYLAHLTTATCHGLQAPLTVRVIEYRLQPKTAQRLAQLAQSRNSRRSDPTALHRLVTTLLDPSEAPTIDLILLYHERWEVELTIDETRTHQRLAARPLRSKTPLGVLQELYGLQLAQYAVRYWMVTSAAQADLDPDRLSFTPAIQVLHDALPLLSLVPAPTRPLVLQHLLAELRLPSTSSLALQSARSQTQPDQVSSHALHRSGLPSQTPLLC